MIYRMANDQNSAHHLPRQNHIEIVKNTTTVNMNTYLYQNKALIYFSLQELKYCIVSKRQHITKRKSSSMFGA